MSPVSWTKNSTCSCRGLKSKDQIDLLFFDQETKDRWNSELK